MDECARRRRREFVAALAAGAVAVAGCGRTGPPTSPSAPDPRPSTAAAKAPPAHSATPPKPSALALPHRGFPVLYVKRGRRVDLRAQPDGQVVHRAGWQTVFGSRTTMALVRRDGRWGAVISPFLPNNELGWVQLDPKKLGIYASDYSIDVDLSTRQATVFRLGQPSRSFLVSVGAPGTDTPTGHFAVTDTFRGHLSPAYGCCALALSAHQPHIPSGWLGGSRIAIHGTYDVLGAAISHGCIRAANDDVSWMVDHVPIGTPVSVHP